MSLQNLITTVLCSRCGLYPVPIGRQGDTGTKKCDKCKNELAVLRNRIKGRDAYRRKHPKHCKRCGVDVTHTGIRKRSEMCVDCGFIIRQKYFEKHDCIYCGKRTKTARTFFCSHTCRQKARYVVHGRKKK